MIAETAAERVAANEGDRVLLVAQTEITGLCEGRVPENSLQVGSSWYLSLDDDEDLLPDGG